MPDFPEPHENLPTPKPDTQVAGNNRTALDDLQPYDMRELLPDDALISIERSLTWQGAYPPPEAVERFERVLPGAFDRILGMAEEAQRSQIRVTEQAQSFLQRDTRRSHYLGAFISALAVLAAATCGLLNHPGVAVALVGIPVMAVARAFIAPQKAPGADRAPPQDAPP